MLPIEQKYDFRKRRLTVHEADISIEYDADVNPKRLEDLGRVVYLDVLPQVSDEDCDMIAKAIGVKTMISLSDESECKTDSQKVLLLENLKRTAEIVEKEEDIY